MISIKNKILWFLFLVMATYGSFAQTNNITIISSINIQNDYVLEGVKGINLSYKYNFLPLEEKDHNDTILKNCVFIFTTKLFENKIPIESAIGHDKYSDNNGEYIHKLNLYDEDAKATIIDKTISVFIPYASLKLTEGKHTISINTEVSKKEENQLIRFQKIEKENIVINKPPTRTITFDIDYIDINTLNSSGNSWDVGIFKTDAPDIDVSIMLATSTVWNKHVNDSYSFSMGSNSRNISFVISKDDQVNIFVQDLDILFHDYITKWQFDTSNKELDQVINFDKAKGNIKSCKISYKITN